MQKKYELIDSNAEYNAKRLRRVKALRDFGDVKAGAIGGHVEHERNLSHEGNCWIDGNAIVAGYATVENDAFVGSHAIVSDRAKVNCQAHVIAESRVSGFATITANAVISGRAVVSHHVCVQGSTFVENEDYLFGRAVIEHEDDYVCLHIKYPILILQDVMYIGCQAHTHAEWQAMSWDMLNDMSEDAVEYWASWGPLLMRECYAVKRRVAANIKKGLGCE